MRGHFNHPIYKFLGLVLVSFRRSKWRTHNYTLSMLLVVAITVNVAVTQEVPQDSADFSILRPGPSLKEWRKNTNFDNVANWEGLAGNENCSQNIYEFPSWYSGNLVVTLPTKFVGKQIILPIKGHFVFPEGTTQFLTPELTPDTSCRGREVKFLRTTRADWFDPDNWIQRDNARISADGESLWMQPSLSAKFTKDAKNIQISATPHVERVPCQYDFVRFPGNSTFNLKISTNVTIAGFFLGDRKQSYTDVAILMSSPLGKLQFQKKPEIMFSITTKATSNAKQTEPEKPASTSTLAACGGNDEHIKDSDSCICANYGDRERKQKICSLVDCSADLEDDCPNPITPHGFCCPICGFHLKIKHSGNLRLVPLNSKLKSELTRANLQGKIHMHLGRYKGGAAHIMLVAASRVSPNSEHNDTSVLVQMGKLVVRIQSILNKEESEVIEVTLTESWGDLLPSGESSGISASQLEGSGMGGGLISLIVILVLFAVLVGIALFIFIWNKKSGYPPLSLSSMTASFPRMSSMRIPIVSGGGSGVGGGRRSSTLSNSLQSFGFARFTNERASSVTLGRAETEAAEGEKSAGKSSSIRRAEQVDDHALPSESTPESNVTDSNSGAFGFSPVSYDLVAGMDVGKEMLTEEKPVEKGKLITPLLTIPEVVVVDMEDESDGGTSPSVDSSSTKAATPPIKVVAPQTPSGSAGVKKEDSGKTGKLSTPGFLASRMASAYKKLAPDGDEGNDEENKQEDVIASSAGRRLFKRLGQNTNYQNMNKTEEKENIFTTPEVTEKEDTQGAADGQQRDLDDISDTRVPTEAATTHHVEEAKIIDF